MNKRYLGVVGFAAISALSGDVQAQQTLVLDLGAQNAGTATTQSVVPGTYQVRIDNRVEKQSYRVSVITRNIQLPAFTAPAAPAAMLHAASCTAVSDARKDVAAAYAGTSEATVHAAVKEAAKIESVPPCVDEVAELRRLVDMSRIYWEPEIVLRAGQELVITVVRAPTTLPTVEPEKTWEKTYTTGPRGEWRTTYGFATVFTRLGTASGAFAKRSSYSLQSAGGTTTIIEHKDRGGAELVPAVLFHYMPARQESSNWVRGWNAGVSFDGTNPLMMFGIGGTYNQNVNLSVGAMAKKEHVLLSKYDAGQVVPSDLDEKQLTESSLRIRPYIMLTFRFSSSPFTKNTTPAQEVPPEH